MHLCDEIAFFFKKITGNTFSQGTQQQLGHVYLGLKGLPRTNIHAETQPRATYALAETPQAVSHVIARGPEQHISRIVQQRKQMIPTPIARQNLPRLCSQWHT